MLKTNKGINWFNFTREWLENKNDFNILYVSYEKLKNNFEETIKEIARFVNIEVTDERIQLIKENSSFENMKLHESKFGDAPLKNRDLVFNQFIRKGKSGEGKKYLNEKQIAYFDKKFKTLIKPFEHLIR